VRVTARVWAIAIFATFAMAAACGATAKAATEFCPAVVTDPYPHSPQREATTYHYRLRALGPRIVEGTIVADTDAGWFTWSQQPVQLTRATYTTTTPYLKVTSVVAESAELSVTFPQAVGIRHAWIATAATQGGTNWDALGKVACDPPDFAPPSSPNTATPQRTPLADDPSPAPPPPAAAAAPTFAPFPPAICPHPFVHAKVTDAVQPVFPVIMQDSGVNQSATSLVYVAVNPVGKLVDAWIFASSGYPALDQAALTAARRSEYAPATSYCRPVSGLYLFAADFKL